MITEKEIDEELERFCNDKEFIGIEDSQKTIKISLHKKVWKDVIMQLLERKINTFEISDSITMFLKQINENFILNRTTDIVYEEYGNFCFRNKLLKRTKTAFSKRLHAELGIEAKNKKVNGKVKRMYRKRGLMMKNFIKVLHNCYNISYFNIKKYKNFVTEVNIKCYKLNLLSCNELSVL